MRKLLLLFMVAALAGVVVPTCAHAQFGTTYQGNLTGPCRDAPTLGVDTINGGLYGCFTAARIWKQFMAVPTVGTAAPVSPSPNPCGPPQNNTYFINVATNPAMFYLCQGATGTWLAVGGGGGGG